MFVLSALDAQRQFVVGALVFAQPAETRHFVAQAAVQALAQWLPRILNNSGNDHIAVIALSHARRLNVSTLLARGSLHGVVRGEGRHSAEDGAEPQRRSGAAPLREDAQRQRRKKV
jgi:hypothetical protein